MNEVPDKPKITYAFDDTTKAITRTDRDGSVATLATLKEGVLEYASDDVKKQYHAAVVRFLNDEKLRFEILAVKGAPRDVPNPNIPPKPKMDPRFGDKTPAVVEWYQKYRPEEFKSRYGIVGPGKVIKQRQVVDPTTGRPRKQTYEEDALLSSRKIHLTEKLEANDQGGEE